MLRWWQHVYRGGGGPLWLNTSLPGSHVNSSVSRPRSRGRNFNSELQNKVSDSPCPHDTMHAGCSPRKEGGGGVLNSLPWERRVAFQIRGQDCFYSLPLVWPHSQEQLHFPEPTPPCSPLTARLDRVVRVSVRAHACAQLCVLVCFWVSLDLITVWSHSNISERKTEEGRPALWPMHTPRWTSAPLTMKPLS